MATFANLVVKLKANTSEATKQLQSFNQAAGQTLTSVTKQATRLAKVFSVAIAGGIVAATIAINKFAAQIDKVAKSAQLLGTTAGDLQQLQFFGELAGVSAETLTMGIQRFNRRIAEAAAGTGEAKKAIEELGLSAQELNTLPLIERFFRVGEAISAVDNANTRLRLGFKFFDSEGAAIIRIFQGDVQKLRQEFQELGVGITTSQAKAVEAFQDSKSVFNFVFRDLGQQITANVAPAFTSLITAINKVIMEYGGLGAVAQSVAQIIVQTSSGIIRTFATLARSIGFIKSVFLDLRDTLSDVFQSLETRFQRFNQFLGEAQIGAIEAQLERARQRGQDDQIAQLEESLRAAQERTQRAASRANLLTQTERQPLDNTEASFTKFGDSLDKIAESLGQTVDPTTMLSKSASTASGAADKLTDSLNNASKSVSSYEKVLNEILGINPQNQLSGITEQFANDPAIKLINALREDRLNTAQLATAATPAFNSLPSRLNTSGIITGNESSTITINLKTDVSQTAELISNNKNFVANLEEGLQRYMNNQARQDKQ